MGHFDVLLNNDKHKRQYCVSFANAIDCNCDAVFAELPGLPCALTIVHSRPISLCNYVGRTLFEEDIAFTLPCLQLC